MSFILSPKLSDEDSACGTNSPTSDDYNEEETYMSSLFHTEPLYQFYDNDGGPSRLNSNNNNNNNVTDVTTGEDMYECVEHPDSLIVDGSEIGIDPVGGDEEDDRPTMRYSRPSAMDLTSACSGGRRSMWGELPEVVQCGILDQITPEAKQLHEAMFEVITSEASYLKSLNILMKHFAQSPLLIGPDSVISKWDHKRLFAELVSVRQCSEKFLEDLEKRWQSSVLLDGLCEVVRDHARDNFYVYVKYCSNQVDQDRILRELNGNAKFVDALKELEADTVCQSLAMHSFLMLPMQRITRLPLLLDAIFNRLDEQSAEFDNCKEALDIINKVK